MVVKGPFQVEFADVFPFGAGVGDTFLLLWVLALVSRWRPDWLDTLLRDPMSRTVPYRAVQVWAEIREQREAQEGPW